MIPVQLRSRKANHSVQCKALVDRGATGSFISWRLVKQHHMKKVLLPKPITIRNADDTTNKYGQITHQVFLAVKIQKHHEVLCLYVSDVGEDDLLLGYNWLHHHNPTIDWREPTIDFSRCNLDCQLSMDEKCRPFEPPKSEVKARRCQNPRARCTTQATEMAIADHQKKDQKTFEDMVPEHYQQYAAVFDENTS